LAEMDLMVKNVETNLAEADLRITDQAARICDQDKELEIAHSKLKESKDRYKDEARILKNKVEAEAKKSSKLSEALTSLQETCSSFVERICSRKFSTQLGQCRGKRIILMKTFRGPRLRGEGN
jgi:predicted  nucleic acid-binding Zn-ribbon protein